jgi:excisionase family DNA binding protein
MNDNAFSQTPNTLTVEMARKRHPAVARNRIYNAVRSGSLPGIKVGKRLAIPTEELDHWVMAGCPVECDGDRDEADGD